MIPIANYENRYKINAVGEVLNLANNKKLTPIKNSNGYLKVSLANGDGTAKQCLIHILVAKHYLPNPYGYPEVNHKDGNKSWNWYGNLEWCTSQQNAQHALKTGLRPGYMSANEKEEHMFAVLGGIQVKDIAIKINRRPETLHKMLRETAKRLNMHGLWKEKMRENRRNAAIRNLEKINN